MVLAYPLRDEVAALKRCDYPREHKQLVPHHLLHNGKSLLSRGIVMRELAMTAYTAAGRDGCEGIARPRLGQARQDASPRWRPEAVPDLGSPAG